MCRRNLFRSVAVSRTRCFSRRRFAESVLHLFQEGFTPTPSNVLADYTAQEADYDTYEPQTMAAGSTRSCQSGIGLHDQFARGAILDRRHRSDDTQ